MAGRGKRDWLQRNIGTFLREYRRKAQRGLEPNDRKYDRKVETEIKRMDPQELSDLMSGNVDESSKP